MFSFGILCVVWLRCVQESPLTITAFGYTFVGYPVGIPGQHYGRSNLLFNICFVFDEDSPAVTAHMPVVCKLGQFMRALEVCRAARQRHAYIRPRNPAFAHARAELNLRWHHQC